jgi:hypothetical protein
VDSIHYGKSPECVLQTPVCQVHSEGKLAASLPTSLSQSCDIDNDDTSIADIANQSVAATITNNNSGALSLNSTKCKMQMNQFGSKYFTKVEPINSLLVTIYWIVAIPLPLYHPIISSCCVAP